MHRYVSNVRPILYYYCLLYEHFYSSKNRFIEVEFLNLDRNFVGCLNFDYMYLVPYLPIYISNICAGVCVYIEWPKKKCLLISIFVF